MCSDCDMGDELKRLPQLLQERGWSCSEIREGYSSSSPGNWIQGSSGPCEKHHGITIYMGTAFQVIARDDDLKVRVAWPGQFSTTYSCYTADQVVWWLDKILVMAERDMAEKLARFHVQ
jgi:hypothetical protein